MEGTYCRALAGTTMHLIINSLDTRRWMSDGVSPAADGEQRDDSGGEGVGLLQEQVWRVEERKRKRETGVREGERERERRRSEERMVVWRKVGGAEGGG